MLIYCYSVLLSNPKSSKLNRFSFFGLSSKRAAEEEDEEENRFAAFGVDADDMDAEDDEETFPSRPIPRPEAIENPMTVDELLASDDRTDATIFLLTLDELMHAISHQYEVIGNGVRSNRRNMIPPSAMVSHLLEGAVTSNMAIQQVAQLEMELQAQHDHLTTPFRLLATLVMPEVTVQVASVMRQHAVEKCKEKDITIFLGDCIECFFRNPSDECNRRDTIVQDFCAQYQVDSAGRAELEQVLQGVERIVLLEVPLKAEMPMVSQMRTHLANNGLAGVLPKTHSWLRNMEYVGGNRAIHHTLRLLQMFGGVIKSTSHDKKLIPKRGFFGRSPWVIGRAKTIHGDLDELLMSDILPDWVLMCREGVVGKARLPYEGELCPLFVCLRNYVDEPEKPVTWSLTFGVHAMLTSILMVGQELQSIINESKQTFNMYFKQVEYAVDRTKTEGRDLGGEMQDCPAWLHNSSMVSFLQNFGNDVFDDRAIWNPLCSGTNFMILTYLGNLEGGCAVIDCQAQLRINLYMYHGLLINGFIQRGDIHILDVLYDVFKGCKAIWGGSMLPRKGELVQRFWICFGMSLRESKQMAVEAQKIANSSGPVNPSLDKSLSRGRKMVPVEPSELSTSYRRICHRDFDGVVDKYHTPEQRRISKDSDQYAFAVRTNDTLDALEAEQTTMYLNFISAGYLLEQFVRSLGRVMKWEPLLQEYKRQTKLNERQAFASLFAQHLLGALDFSKDPLNVEFMGMPGICVGSAGFMEEFYKRMPDPLWFQAVKEEGEVSKTLLSSGFR